MSKQIGTGIEVCVIEGDEGLRSDLVRALARMGFNVRGFGGARDLYLGLLTASCRVLVIDIDLPGEDGFVIVEELKAAGQSFGVVVLTAQDGTDGLVRSLAAGADAYLIKPADYRELAANIVSLSRRFTRETPVMTPELPNWRLEGDGWSLLSPSGALVPLTASERVLLQAVFAEVNGVVTRDAIVLALGHQPAYYMDHRLDMLVSRLRRKVREMTDTLLPLKAVRGVGFMMSLNLR